MAIGTVQIHVSQLKLGMFVTQLDRPWLGTPFLFQGFRIRSVEEIEKLKSLCDSVHIDLEKSARASLTTGRTDREQAAPRRVYNPAPLGAEDV